MAVPLVRETVCVGRVPRRGCGGTRGSRFAMHSFGVSRAQVVGVAIRAIMRAQIQDAANKLQRQPFTPDAISLHPLTHGTRTLSRDSMKPHKTLPCFSARSHRTLGSGAGGGSGHFEPILGNLHIHSMWEKHSFRLQCFPGCLA